MPHLEGKARDKVGRQEPEKRNGKNDKDENPKTEMGGICSVCQLLRGGVRALFGVPKEFAGDGGGKGE